MKRSIFDRSTMHPRDAERFRPGGMFGTKRWFNDPPPVADWRTSLPEDLRGAEALKDVKDVAGLAKRFVDTQRLVGDSIRVPKADAAPEERAAFRERLRKADPDLVEIPKDEAKRKEVLGSIWETLGRPKDEKGYSLEGVQLEAGVAFSDEDIAALRQAAKRRGYTTDQFKAFAGDVVQERAAALKADKARNAELRTEFGLAYDDRMKEIAVIAEKTNAPQYLRDAIAKGQVDKGIAHYLLALSKQLGVDPREVALQRGTPAGAKTPEEAEAEIKQLLPKLTDPKTDPDERKRLMARFAELEKYASPHLVEKGG
jgi:hypothetical protein